MKLILLFNSLFFFYSKKKSKLDVQDQKHIVSLSAPISKHAWQRVHNETKRPRILLKHLNRRQKADRDQIITSMNDYLTDKLGWLTVQYEFAKTSTGYSLKRRCRHPKCPTSFVMTANASDSNGLLTADIQCDHF